MRVKHYFKNILVFLPLVFSMSLTNVPLLLRALLGFAAFCFVASVIYIVNDIRDIDKDRQHSTKCNRPLASGAVSVKAAVILAVVLGLLAVGCLVGLYFLSGESVLAPAVWLALYFVLNLGYSFGLKNIPVLDLFILASGFVFRVFFGGAVTGIAISDWLILVMASGALYMGMGKRRNELLREGENTRAVNRKYTVGFLDKNMYVCVALTLVFYALWCISSDSVELFVNGSLTIWSLFFVLFILLRYSLVIERNSDGDPVNVLFHDKMLLLLVIAYVAYMFVVVYVPLPWLVA